MIKVSESASKKIVAMMKDDGFDAANDYVRVGVKSGGCSGLSYVIDYVAEPMAGDIVLPLTANFLICIDKNSYPYLKGIYIDYVKQGLNHKFLFNNPNQTGQCGCGESFTVDEII